MIEDILGDFGKVGGEAKVGTEELLRSRLKRTMR
jgi:hypothetical protein